MASPPVATTDSATRVPPALRRVPWPRVAPVDLANEFPWLILHERAAEEWAARTDATEGGGDDRALRADAAETTTASVYAQPLRVPRSPPPAWSPAQRAARKMLQLQDEMDRRDEYARLRAQAAAAASSPASRSPTKAPPKSPAKVFAPGRAIVSRAERATRQAAASATPQARLQQWLSRQPPSEPHHIACSTEMATRILTKTHATLGAGLWADEVASPIAAELTSESVFGGHVATRRLAFAPPLSPTEKPPDPTTATHAERLSLPSEPVPSDETTSHQVAKVLDHGSAEALTPTVIFPGPSVSPPRDKAPRVSIITQFADDVRDDARALVAQGDVTDALVVLQRGIDRVLRDFQDNADELRSRGFDFSALAHAMARRLQRAYRRRHARRVTSLVRLQRVWRRTRGRRAFLAQRAFLARAAGAIQRPYRLRFIRKRRERSAVRIQRCFRVFQSQKLLVWLHRACRLLTTDHRRLRELKAAQKRRRRRLWVRLTVVVMMLRLVAQRRRRVSLAQAQWRGRCARQAYAQALARAVDREAQRRRREDAFVEPRVARFRDAMRLFYSDTRHGRSLAAWRRRAPWLRWRRLRGSASRDGLDRATAETTLCAMFRQRDGGAADDVVVLRGLDACCVGAMLARPLAAGGYLVLGDESSDWRPRSARSDTPHSVAPSTSPPRGWKQRLNAASTRWTSRWTHWRRAATRTLHAATWTLVVYPTLAVAATSALFRRRRRRAQAAAVETLLDDHERVALALLRRVFQAQREDNRPPFVCAWCGAGAATARLFFTHRHAAGCVDMARRADRECAATVSDVAHGARWRGATLRKLLWKLRRSPAVPRGPTPTTVSADDAFVRRVAVRRGLWGRFLDRSRATALRCLLDAAAVCGPPDGAAVLPAALLAQLVWLLDTASGHALERLDATTHGSAPWTESVAWIGVDEAARVLGLAPDATHAVPWTLPWQRRRAYRIPTPTSRGWCRGVLARVAALA